MLPLHRVIQRAALRLGVVMHRGAPVSRLHQEPTDLFRRYRRFAILGPLLLILSSCATPQGGSASGGSAAGGSNFDRLAYAKRMARVGERILFAATPLCAGRVRPAVGFVAWNAYSLGEAGEGALRREFGLGDEIEVVAVGERTPAEAAGIQARDKLVGIGGEVAPRGRNAVAAAVGRIRALSRRGSFTMRLLRNGKPLTVRVRPRPRCAVRYFVLRLNAINAATDGRRIFITRGVMRFANQDTELAVIFGHELAHIVLNHPQLTRAARRRNPNASRNARRAFSVALEKEADYYGLYLAALAGYDVSNAANLWRRMAVRYPGLDRFVTTHPRYSERILLLQSTAAEIARQKAAGRPLRPQVRPGSNFFGYRPSRSPTRRTAPRIRTRTTSNPFGPGTSDDTPRERRN